MPASRSARTVSRRSAGGGPRVAPHKSGGFILEGGDLAPAPPVLRLQPAVDAERRHIAVGAGEGAVPRGSERVRESGFGDEPGGRAEDAERLGAPGLKE